MPKNPPGSHEDAPGPPESGARDGSPALPPHVAGSGGLDRLADAARGYARDATAANTNAAYRADWAHYTRWCRMRGAEPLPPSPGDDRPLHRPLRGAG